MPMNKKILYAKTPTSIIQYSLQSETAEVQDFTKYMDIKVFHECCKLGCPNYGMKWSCPPYAPDYGAYVRDYKLLTVFLLKAELSQFSYIKNDYLKIKAANSILKSRIDNTLRFFKNDETHYISTGSCRLCKPCKRKLNIPCAHPDLMSYSFEAMGINVTHLVRDLFEEELLWYSKKMLPQYTCVVAGLLCKKEIPFDTILETKWFQPR